MVTVEEFMAFRRELVEAERSHPEWRKTSTPVTWPARTVIPDSPGAKTYWRLRNGTRGLVRQWSNELEDLWGPGYARYISQIPKGTPLGEGEERLASKWMAEWEELRGSLEG